MKSISGFGMIQVMVGVVVIGIMSMVFIRKSLNRQDLGIALQLISYRDQVLDYYTALASNRISWQNTRASNSSDWSTDNISVDLKDADGSTRIPKPGLKLSYDDNVVKGTILPNPLSTCKPVDSDGEYKEANHFCLTATKLRDNKLMIKVEYRKKDHTPAQMESYVVKPVERSINFWVETVGKVCEGKAVAGLNFENRAVTCSVYNLIRPDSCDPSNGQKALIGFNNSSGQIQCSGNNNVLIPKDALPTTPASGIASIDNFGIPTVITGYVAVQPYDCGDGYATIGWNSDGSHAGCREIKIGNDGPKGPIGFYGLEMVGEVGPRGDKGRKGIDGKDEIGEQGPKGGRGPRGPSRYCCSSCSPSGCPS